MQFSISTRLTLYYGLSLSLILFSFVIYLYSSFHIGLHEDLEEQLRRDEVYFHRAIRFVAGRPVLALKEEGEHGREGEQREGRERNEGEEHGEGEEGREEALHFSDAQSAYIRLIAPNGDVLGESANLAAYQFVEPHIPAENKSTYLTLEQGGRPALSLYTPVLNRANTVMGWLEITRFETGIHRALHQLEHLLTIGTVLGIILSMGVGHLLARRALKPIAEITQAANAIQIEELEKRLPTEFAAKDELTDLAHTLNHLLERLESSVQRERRFRADAAHQMFTPIAALQSEIEITLRRERSRPEYEQSLNQVYHQSENLSKIVEGLLQISRAESIYSEKAEAINISALAREQLLNFVALAEKSDIKLSSEIEQDIQLAIYPEHFNAVASNLIENALKYTPAGGEVKISLRKKDGGVQFAVADTGIGLTKEERQLLFDRFYRSERKEVNQIRGIGLGLSIVQAIVNAYEGTIQAQSDGQGKGSTFLISFSHGLT